MTGFDCDVAIVGAGLAGAACAAVLAGRGRKLIMLEARDRVGGRAYTRGFSNGEPLLEFGGSWIAPWHDRIRHYADLTGITLRPTHPVNEHRWHDGETLRSGVPASDEVLAGFRTTQEGIRRDVDLYKAGKLFAAEETPPTFSQYLDRIGVNAAARAHAMAWWTISGNGDPDRISATEFISSCAYGGGLPESMMTALRHTLVPGASILAERMIERSGAEVKRRFRVAEVHHADKGVTIISDDGRRIKSRDAALCLPLNVLSKVKFSPMLSPRKREAATDGHGGRSIKIWIKARGARPGTLATGGPGGLRWLFAERDAPDGACLIVGFALDDKTFDPSSRADVAAGLARFFPEAELVSWDWHDWISDPEARGTWVALPADRMWIGDPATWVAEGRIAFASSDFAAQSAGWFEGAVRSGEAAAEDLLAVLETR